jgi:hypothetical protein
MLAPFGAHAEKSAPRSCLLHTLITWDQTALFFTVNDLYQCEDPADMAQEF